MYRLSKLRLSPWKKCFWCNFIGYITHEKLWHCCAKRGMWKKWRMDGLFSVSCCMTAITFAGHKPVVWYHVWAWWSGSSSLSGRLTLHKNLKKPCILLPVHREIMCPPEFVCSEIHEVASCILTCILIFLEIGKLVYTERLQNRGIIDLNFVLYSLK